MNEENIPQTLSTIILICNFQAFKSIRNNFTAYKLIFSYINLGGLIHTYKIHTQTHTYIPTGTRVRDTERETKIK